MVKENEEEDRLNFYLVEYWVKSTTALDGSPVTSPRARLVKAKDEEQVKEMIKKHSNQHNYEVTLIKTNEIKDGNALKPEDVGITNEEEEGKEEDDGLVYVDEDVGLHPGPSN